MTVPSKRAEHLSAASLVLSIVFFVITLLVGRWSGYFAIWAVSWLILSAVLIWFVLWIQFHHHCLTEQEKLDLSQLTGGQEASTIFQSKGEKTELFAVAQARLKLLEKWFLPIFSVIIALYQMAIGFYLLKAVFAQGGIEPKQPLICAVCMMAIAFVSFLMSRYATGMSASGQFPQWKPLRAGGSSLLGVAILCFVLAISLAMVQFKIFIVLNVAEYVIGVLLVVLGIETTLNVILDIYRPRIKGLYSRSAFDSRLLGILNEPAGLLHTAAGAIDYQFGFKVSQTWFYKLLEKAIVPLILFAVAVLYLLSCVVIVAPNEEAVIEHFGNPARPGGEIRKVGPGLSFKWPWPVDMAYKYPTKKIMEISIGFIPRDYEEGQVREALIWGKSHYKEEYNLLVASKQTVFYSETEAVPVSLLMAAVPVQYRIKDLYSFLYNHKETEKILESICYRQLTRFAAGATIEVDSKADLEHSLLGAGRAEAKKILTERIQAAADKQGLGVEIVFLGLQGIHPPPEVAVDYQNIVAAVQKKQAIILDALGQRNKTLSDLAGSVEQANRLYDLAADYQLANEENQTDKIEKLAGDLDDAFAQARGNIFSTLRKSRSYAFEKAALAEATGQRFASQLEAYNAAPQIYKHQQRLAVFEESLENTRKYVVAADKEDTQVFIVDVKEKLTPSLYELGGFEETSEK